MKQRGRWKNRESGFCLSGGRGCTGSGAFSIPQGGSGAGEGLLSASIEEWSLFHDKP
jgi:hypothetical protein